jgi:hypothetical protein
LLALDQIHANEHRAGAKTGGAYGVRQQAAGVIRKRFVEEGLQAAPERKKRETPPRIKIDGEAEAQITAPACSQPPEGRCRRALVFPAKKAAGTGVSDSIPDHGIGGLLKKTKLSHGCRNSGV